MIKYDYDYLSLSINIKDVSNKVSALSHVYVCPTNTSAL